jgi:hypothetical protein
MAAVPPSLPDARFAERLQADARDLRDRLTRPLLCSAAVIYDGADRHRLETLTATALRRAPACWPPPTRGITIPNVAASPTC